MVKGLFFKKKIYTHFKVSVCRPRNRLHMEGWFMVLTLLSDFIRAIYFVACLAGCIVC